MNGDALNTAGLSGDLGWNEGDDRPANWLSSAALVLACGAVWGVNWFLSGLPPLMPLASPVPTGPQSDAEHATVREGAWKNKQA
jgi:hypothetical protein